MNRTKYRGTSIFLVSTIVVATICSFATFYVHADDDHTNVSHEQVQASNEQIKKDDALNIISNSSLTTDTQKITNSNSTESTSTSDTKLQNESTTSSTDIIEEKSDSESTELPQNERSTRAPRSNDNVFIDGTWLTPAQGNTWLSNWDYVTRTAKDGTVYVRLLKYKGVSGTIVIPGIIPTKNGTRRVVINSLDQSSTDYLFSGKESLLRTVKFVDGQWRDKVYKVGVTGNTGCGLAFRYANNLQMVDLSGLDFSTPTTDYTTQITNMSYMFQGCSNLTQVIFPNNGTNIIDNAEWMFLKCTSLDNPGLVNIANFFNTSLGNTHGMFANSGLTSAPNIQMSYVQDMGAMFTGCSSLTSFDVTNVPNFRVYMVTTMTDMFRECSQLKLVNFSKIIPEYAVALPNPDKTDLFYTSQKTPLIFIVPDERKATFNFDNYNFSGDNRTVNQYPMLNSNGGTFSSSNTTTLSYFNSCAVKSTQLDMSTFNSWLNRQIPKKTGTTFLRWNTETTAQTVLDLVNQQALYLAEWIQMPKTATDNRTLNTQEPLAIAYLPNVFTTGNQPIPLQNGGQQMVPFVKSTTLNIGIRDQRKSNTTWDLTAQLVGNSSNLPADAYLQVGDQTTVTLNINNGTAYNPLLDLQPVKNQNPVGKSNAKITTTPNTILSKNSSTELNGVYDLDLGNISLVLPNSQNVAVGNYSATVSWNLVTAP